MSRESRVTLAGQVTWGGVLVSGIGSALILVSGVLWLIGGPAGQVLEYGCYALVFGLAVFSVGMVVGIRTMEEQHNEAIDNELREMLDD